MEEECRNATQKLKEEIMTFEVEQAGNAANEAGRWQNNDSSKVKKSLAKLLGQVKKHQTQMSWYVSAPEIELDADLLQCWSMHTAAYPSLAKLASKCLCICSTRSASERLSSVAGNIVTAKQLLNL
ncbi:zinc finger BED domain-containing 1-like [Paramuricea clavata]|uniref:Zinc finger BED domain-containing 1-like n=1 Tax=Paramuricea clavata TaxID=317549 RepID=A0A7D9E0X1_PARCT|nr:zinc finger BED domain-containing 1-like [Paramuricea clavata]